MRVDHSSIVIDMDVARGSYKLTLTYLPQDVKHFLQEYLRDLKKYKQPNRFTQAQLEDVFTKEMFDHFEEGDARDLAMWAFRLAWKKNYITSNIWDRETPSIWFINDDILKLVPGPRGPRKNSQVKLKENHQRIKEQIEEEKTDGEG